ncbi:hypothetical protein Tco_0382914, partial [Tanacetum coccineum]
EEIHPQLPGPDDTIHERPAGKVGMYTRFFDYVNYRIPFSNFFVSILTHFRIPFSQLSVFGSAKVDEFVVPASARFGWFSGTNIVKDRAPTISEYNVEHDNTLIAQASPFLSMRTERVEMDLNDFIRTADPRKVRIVERARTENERPIVTVAKHRTVTLLPTSVPRPSGELSDSVEREFGEDVSGSSGKGQEKASVGSHGNVELIVPVTDDVVAETGSSKVKRSKKKRVIRESEDTPSASHPPKKLRADYGKTSGCSTRGKSPSVINRLLRDSQLMVEQGVAALPTLPFITSSVTASPLEEGEDNTDSATGPDLRTIGPSERFVVLSDSSHHSSAKSADAEVDSLIRSIAPVMTVATTLTTSVSAAATTTVTPDDAGRCLNDLEAYNHSAEADFNSAAQNLRGLDFPLLQELSAKKDASIWLMVPVCRKQDQAVIGSQALFVALDICHGRVQKIERNLIERLPFLKDVFVSIDNPFSAEALTILPETPTEPPVTALTTTALSTVVVRPSFGPSLLVEDYENPNLVGAVPKDVILEPGSEGKVGGSTGGDANVGNFVFSELENEARKTTL